MFDRVKRMFGGKSASAPTVAWEKPGPVASSASGRVPTPAPPSLASSRTQEATVPTRSRSAAIMGAPSAESVMAAKRQQTATNSPAKTSPVSDNRRVVKSTKKGERTDVKDFMNIATGGGERNLRQAKAR